MQLSLARAVPVLLAIASAGCATLVSSDAGVPLLKLAPSALGHPLALQQHITVRAAGRAQEMDVLLEADAASVKLAVVAMGQVAARIVWDGRTLNESRSTWLPPSVSSERILNDLQLSLWPLAAVQAALPIGWHAVDDDGTRTLSEDGGGAVLVVRHVGTDTLELEQRRDHYQLTIVSQPAAGTAP